MNRIARVLLWICGIPAGLYVLTYLAFTSSPWPSALLIRRAFDAGAAQASLHLQSYVPDDVDAVRNVRYGGSDGSLALDLYRPRASLRARKPLLTVVWVHGGGWISGSKADIANYAQILAARGFAVAVVDYHIAPAAIYPQPVRDVNAALGFLREHAANFDLDRDRFVLAGDSAGAQIAAQVAAFVREPSYAAILHIEPAVPARAIAGALLYCGVYSTKPIASNNPFAGFIAPVLWAYSGKKAPQSDPYFHTASVADYVTRAFPPAFISAGNGDPLLMQSRGFAHTLAHHGVQVDSLFFPSRLAPALPHEYQFDLRSVGGRLALQRSVAFLAQLWVQPTP